MPSRLTLLVALSILASAACDSAPSELDIDRYCDALVTCLEAQEGSVVQTKEQCVSNTEAARDAAAQDGCEEPFVTGLDCVIEPLEDCSEPIANAVAVCVDETNAYNECVSPEG
ncbi:MAG: hypothetical protein R3B72_07185 [Polyangiaceae bacterium]